MKAVIQRVANASVSVDNEIVGKIDKGYLILLGVGQNDTKSDAEFLAKKIVSLRIFEDENGKTNLSLNDIDGDVLSISQFTLYADCKHGRRPSFIYSGSPELANELYIYFNEQVEALTGKRVEKGIFGADMKVTLLNDGPFTILLDTEELKK